MIGEMGQIGEGGKCVKYFLFECVKRKEWIDGDTDGLVKAGEAAGNGGGNIGYKDRDRELLEEHDQRGWCTVMLGVDTQSMWTTL